MLATLRNLPLAMKILIGLVLGAGLGLALPPAGQNGVADQIIGGAGVLGKLWLSALQMTILPLVFSLIATTFVRSSGLAEGGGIARRTIIVVALLYGFGIVASIVLTPILLGLFPVPPDVAAALQSMAGSEVALEPLPIADMILGMVPKNIVAAMAGQSLLPVLIFALLFGAAMAKLDAADKKKGLVDLLMGISETMFIIVGWILAIAPFGIAFLILNTAHEHGTDLLVGLAHYLALTIAILIIFILLLYVLAMVVTRYSPLAFAKALLPTQVVAFGTQSSLACLPLILKSCDALGIRKETSGVAVPLAVTLMRVNSPVTGIFAGAYGAVVYGLPYGIAIMAIAGLIGVLLEVGSVGIPSSATYVALQVPVMAVFGLPPGFVVVLLIVETIPDLFKTVCNVTGDALAAGIVDRKKPEAP